MYVNDCMNGIYIVKLLFVVRSNKYVLNQNNSVKIEMPLRENVRLVLCIICAIIEVVPILQNMYIPKLENLRDIMVSVPPPPHVILKSKLYHGNVQISVMLCFRFRIRLHAKSLCFA